MSKVIYLPSGGKLVKHQKAYDIFEGVTRKISKGYIVRDGVHRQFFSAVEPTFGGYTGNYTVSQVEIDGAVYNLYTITESGTLKLTGDAQFWMCGGGGSGARGASNPFGGGGGGGGHVESGDLTSGSYVISIGAGGTRLYDPADGGDTSITPTNGSVLTAAGGSKASSYNGGDGGSGGGMNFILKSDGSYTRGTAGKGDGISTYPFGLSSLYAHSAGGGGGGVYYSGTITGRGGTGGTNGGNGGSASRGSSTGASGGEKGGGQGGGYTSGSMSYATGGNASFYGGGGGGGKGTKGSSGTQQGAGYSGVCYILELVSA